MPPSALFETQSTLQAQEKPWQRQEGESILWYNRFKRYMDLGPKRSLQQAVEQEQGQIAALKSPDQGTPSSKKRRAAKSEHLTPVAATKVQVPGSWKQASIKWRWVERATLWDAYHVEMRAKTVMEKMQANIDLLFISTLDRVNALSALFKATQEIFNTNNGVMDRDQKNAYLARMQSILKDIREEMKSFHQDFDLSVMRMREKKRYCEESKEKIK